MPKSKESIFYLNNGAGLSSVQSGGNLRHIEVAKVVQEHFDLFCITTIGGLNNYKREGLGFREISIVKAHLWKTTENSNLDRLFAYFLSLVHSLYLVFLKRVSKCDIVYATSDYIFDILPALVYKILYKAKLVCMVHHRVKSPFKRKGNFFLNSISYVFQQLSYFIIKNFADMLFVYDTPEGQKIAKSIKHQNVKYVKNGIDVTFANKIKPQKVKYDCLFAGGLRETKGLYDVIPVCNFVVKEKPDFVLAIAGGGTKEITAKFKELITQHGLTKNIILLGPLDREDLYRSVKSSKIFMSLSHEEGWGISVLEAVALGVPVVAFKLPAFDYLKQVIYQVPMYNHSKFSDCILDILFGNKKTSDNVQKGLTLAKKYDWNEIGNEETSALKQVV